MVCAANSDKNVPQPAQASTKPDTNANKKAFTKVINVGVGAAISSAAAYFCCAAVATSAAVPAVKVKVAVGSGIWLSVSSAVAVIPGLIGFTSSGIASGSIAAKIMSMSAIANSGGVPAGGFVACLQSIGVLGLGSVAVLAIGGIAAPVMGAGLDRRVSQKSAAAAAATAINFWTAPVMRVGIGAIAGAVVGWIVFLLVDGKILY
ncbi:Interferon-induced 6-16 family [Phytophthora infestans]|uniref:Interferon-induced 6-16 family n=1 Tax=Phytophthora infestans TaxID=4787 RepID=A0A8S9V1U2_PHYIN|nr:Interferon-induced 6-16 family [Phytophthora infestans]